MNLKASLFWLVTIFCLTEPSSAATNPRGPKQNTVIYLGKNQIQQGTLVQAFGIDESARKIVALSEAVSVADSLDGFTSYHPNTKIFHPSRPFAIFIYAGYKANSNSGLPRPGFGERKCWARIMKVNQQTGALSDAGLDRYEDADLCGSNTRIFYNELENEFVVFVGYDTFSDSVNSQRPINRGQGFQPPVFQRPSSYKVKFKRISITDDGRLQHLQTITHEAASFLSMIGNSDHVLYRSGSNAFILFSDIRREDPSKGSARMRIVEVDWDEGSSRSVYEEEFAGKRFEKGSAGLNYGTLTFYTKDSDQLEAQTFWRHEYKILQESPVSIQKTIDGQSVGRQYLLNLTIERQYQPSWNDQRKRGVFGGFGSVILSSGSGLVLDAKWRLASYTKLPFDQQNPQFHFILSERTDLNFRNAGPSVSYPGSIFALASIGQASSEIQSGTTAPEEMNLEESKAGFLAAAKYGDLSRIEELARNQASRLQELVQAKEEAGMTGLSLAAANGHFEVVEYLVNDLRAPLNPKDDFGDTPYTIAEKSGYSAIAEFLKERGGRP